MDFHREAHLHTCTTMKKCHGIQHGFPLGSTFTYLYDRMKECHGIQHGFPLGSTGYLQLLLCHRRVSSLEACFQSLGRLVCELDGRLQEIDGKLRVDFRGYPQPVNSVIRMCINKDNIIVTIMQTWNMPTLSYNSLYRYTKFQVIM